MTVSKTLSLCVFDATRQYTVASIEFLFHRLVRGER
jgi:hypothetical protein